MIHKSDCKIKEHKHIKFFCDCRKYCTCFPSQPNSEENYSGRTTSFPKINPNGPIFSPKPDNAICNCNEIAESKSTQFVSSRWTGIHYDDCPSVTPLLDTTEEKHENWCECDTKTSKARHKYEFIALRFHEINLTEGWDKAVAYLEDLLTNKE